MTRNNPLSRELAGSLPEASRKSSSVSETGIGGLANLPIPELPEVLTLREVAQILRCSKAHVCKIINGQVSGTVQLPAIGLGRRKVVRRSTLLSWLSSSEQDATMTSSLEVDAGRRA